MDMNPFLEYYPTFIIIQGFGTSQTKNNYDDNSNSNKQWTIGIIGWRKGWICKQYQQPVNDCDIIISRSFGFIFIQIIIILQHYNTDIAITIFTCSQ